MSDAWVMNNDVPSKRAYPYLVKENKTGVLRIDISLSGKSNDRKSLSPNEFIDLLTSNSYSEKSRVRVKTRGAGSKATSLYIKDMVFSGKFKDELSRRKRVDAAHDSDGLIEHYDNFDSQIDALESLSDDDIMDALKKSSPIPKKRKVNTYAYDRNPFVVIAVLRRAKGKCECCGSNAPFNRVKDGSPYLEVHHEKMLSKGGDDTVENAIALCPNCHRRKHFGEVT